MLQIPLMVDPSCYQFSIKIGYFGLPNLVIIVAVFIILSLIGVFALGFAVFKLHAFLAKNAPVKTDILVVEGWLPDYAIEAAMTEFQKGGYRTLITVGAPLPRGFYLSEYKNFAELAAGTLLALGFNPQKLQVVSTAHTPECRTQSAAIAIKKHLATSDHPIQSINVFTLGPHARRTWLVFCRIFPSPTTVGIIATQVLAYDHKVWWKSSEGVRTVVGELIAYLYRRFWR